MVFSHNRTKYEGRRASRTVPPAGESKKTHNLLIHCTVFKQDSSRYISRDAKFHAAPIKSARGSGTSHRNPKILIGNATLVAPKKIRTSPEIHFQKS